MLNSKHDTLTEALFLPLDIALYIAIEKAVLEADFVINYKQLPSGIGVPGAAAVKSNASPLKQVTVPNTEGPI